MSNASSEQEYAFVVFRTGTDMNRMILPVEEFEPSALELSLKYHFGENAGMVATLDGLTDDEVSTLATIFDLADGIRIKTRQDLTQLLHLRPRTVEDTAVRRAVCDGIPHFLDRIEGDEECAAITTQLYALYERFGGDPDRFEIEAERLMLGVSSSQRANYLTVFQIVMHKMVPLVRGVMARDN